MTYQVYYGSECVFGGYNDFDHACSTVGQVIATNKGTILSAGKDGNNFWWLVKFDDDGNINYESFSVKESF